MKKVWIFVLALVLVSLPVLSLAEDVTIGVTGAFYEDLWQPAIDALAKEGINVKLQQFSDFSLPNNALNSEYYNDQIDCAAWLIYGEKDTTVGSYKISESKSVQSCLEYYIQRYNLTDVDHAKTYRSGPFSHYVFLNEQGVPMFRYSVVDNKGHANLPSESYLLYDEFFSKFYRDDAGVLHYMESDNVLDIR